MLKLLTIELSIIALYLLIRHIYYRYSFEIHHDFKTKLYEFFAIRDKLINLIVDGKMNENDEIFQLIYKRINYSLHYFEQVNRLHIKTIEEIIDKMTEEDLMEMTGLIEKIEQHPSTELKKLIEEFDKKLVKIVLTNSMFYILVKYLIPYLKDYIPTKLKQSKRLTKIRNITNSIDYFGQEAAAIA